MSFTVFSVCSDAKLVTAVNRNPSNICTSKVIDNIISQMFIGVLQVPGIVKYTQTITATMISSKRAKNILNRMYEDLSYFLSSSILL